MPADGNKAIAEPVRGDQGQELQPALEMADLDEVINIGEPMDPDDPSTWD